MDKFIVIPFVMVFAVALGLLGAVAYYSEHSGSIGGGGANQTTSYVYVMSAIFQDVKTGDSGPCSAVQLTVTCPGGFVIGPGDPVKVIVSLQDTGANQTVTFSGFSGEVVLQPASWDVLHGASSYVITGTVAISSPQTAGPFTITLEG